MVETVVIRAAMALARAAENVRPVVTKTASIKMTNFRTDQLLIALAIMWQIFTKTRRSEGVVPLWLFLTLL